MKKFKTVPIVFIGSDPTYFMDKYLIGNKYFVVRGEPEITLLDFCQVWKKID